MSSPESISTDSTSTTDSVGEESFTTRRLYPNSHLTNTDGEARTTFQHSERRSSNPIPPSRYHRPSLSSALNNELPPLPVTEMSFESRRQSMIAMDRKRRLTGSNHETGRRRTTTGRFMDREDRYYESASSAGQYSSRMMHQSPSSPRPTEVIDLTSSPPSAPNREILPHPDRTSSDSSRMYALPKWQPDSEVSECPICHRLFGLLFRRHHCRKCGRVVCNDCSPHRITIPRQFIVHPPGVVPESPTRFARDTVDLTGDDDDNEPSSTLGGQRISNPALGGGEKVRLCNPCVPDPQPDPQSNYTDASSQQLPFAGISPRLPNVPGPSDFPGFHTYSPQNFRERHVFSPQSYPAPPHPGTRVHFPDEDDHDTDSSPDGFGSARRSFVPQTYAPNSRYPGYNISHSRYHSLDITRPPAPLPPPPSLFGNRPRVRSMLDPFPHHPRIPPGMHPPPLQNASLPTSAPRLPRPQIREEDICPICRGLLPAKGANGEETDRENHIMQCITIHDASTSGHGRGRSHSQSLSLSQSPHPTSENEMPTSSSFTQRAPMQMLRFTATEKDCVGEDGNRQECSICMIEYDVGDRLARLECWCKFHDECIVEWFGRKRECPVHKIA